MKCEHVATCDPDLPARVQVCEECVKTGDPWVHLRVCKVCGHVGCCDSSINRHARAHFHETGHAIIGSANAYEDWLWCYAHDAYVTPEGDID